MASVEQQVKISLNKSVVKSLDELEDEEFLNEFGELLVDLVRERTSDGYDVDSRKFGGYNKSYDKQYSYKYNRRTGETFTKFSSNRAGDKLRLTGQLFSAIRSKAKAIRKNSSSVTLQFTIFVKGRKQQEKAEGLQSTTGTARDGSKYSKKAYDFLGLAKRGSYKAKESKAINQFLSDYFKKKINSRVTVK